MNIEIIILWSFFLASIFSACHIAYFAIRHEREYLERVFNFMVVIGLLYYNMSIIEFLLSLQHPRSYSWVVPMACFHIVNFLYLRLRIKYLKLNGKGDPK